MLSITKYVLQPPGLISRTSINSVAINNEINSIINNIVNIYQSGDMPCTVKKPAKPIIPGKPNNTQFNNTAHAFRIYDNEVKPQNIIKSTIKEAKFRSVPAPFNMTGIPKENEVKSQNIIKSTIKEAKFRSVPAPFNMTAIPKENEVKPQNIMKCTIQEAKFRSVPAPFNMTAIPKENEIKSSITDTLVLTDNALNTDFNSRKIKTPDAAAESIVKAFRTFLFQRSHERMMLAGEIWQTQNRQEIHDGVQELSKNNLRRLNHELTHLNPQERKFLNLFMEMKMYATHSTPVNIKSTSGTAILFSRQKLIERNIIFNKNNSPDEDIKLLGNDDFVFFSLEIGDTPKKPSSRFGGTVFRFHFEDKTFFDSAWLSLVEMRFSQTPVLNRHVDGLTDDEYTQLSKRTLNPLHTVFSGGDMKTGIVLSVIKDIRDNLSADSQHKVLGLTDEKSINGLINGFYRPEVKVSRQYFSSNYMEASITKDEKK